MALNYFSMKRYEHLFDDKLFRKVIERINTQREDMIDWYRENDTDRVTCPVCGKKGIRYEWNSILCNCCGWEKSEHVPIPQSSGVPMARNLYQIFKTVFGRKIHDETRDEKPDEEDLDYLPIDLENFDSGEYTEEQIEFLKQRFEDIISTDDVEFSKADLTMIHYLVLQEMKVKKLYRLEAVEDKTDNDFALTKKRELDVLNDLRQDVKEIIESQQKDEDEASYLSDIEEEINKKDLAGIVEEFETKKEKRNKKIKESEKRRKEKEGHFREEFSHEK